MGRPERMENRESRRGWTGLLSGVVLDSLSLLVLAAVFVRVETWDPSSWHDAVLSRWNLPLLLLFPLAWGRLTRHAFRTALERLLSLAELVVLCLAFRWLRHLLEPSFSQVVAGGLSWLSFLMGGDSGAAGVTAHGYVFSLQGRTMALDPVRTGAFWIFPFLAICSWYALRVFPRRCGVFSPPSALLSGFLNLLYAVAAGIFSFLYHFVVLGGSTDVSLEYSLISLWMLPLWTALGWALCTSFSLHISSRVGGGPVSSAGTAAVSPLPGCSEAGGWRLGAMAVCSLIAGFLLAGRGPVETAARMEVIFDESRSAWEPTCLPCERDYDDPVFAENNYRTLLRFLADSVRVRIVGGRGREAPPGVPDSASSLEPRVLWCGDDLCSVLSRLENPSREVLVLKCPTSPYSSEERKAVERFVARGGNLLLIGDHTNVMRMNDYLNIVSTSFGIRYLADSVYSLDGDWIYTWLKDMDAAHPFCRLLGDFYWANGNTLELWGGASPVVRAPVASFTEPARFDVYNFFGNKMIDAEDPLGDRCVIAEASSGRGKVLAFTDSTCFNNMYMSTPGRRRFWRALLHWFAMRPLLMREDGTDPAAWFALSCAAVALMLWLERRNCAAVGRGNACSVMLLVLPFSLGVFLGVSVYPGYALSWEGDGPFTSAPLPSMSAPRSLAAVYAGREPVCIFKLEPRIRYDATTCYMLPFMQHMCRLEAEGVELRVVTEGRLDELLALPWMDVLILPAFRGHWTDDDTGLLRKWVEAGHALVLWGGGLGCDGIRRVAEGFDLGFQDGPYLETADGPFGAGAVPVEGGNPLVRVAGMPVAAWARCGKGVVLLLGVDEFFSDSNEYFLDWNGDDILHDLFMALVELDMDSLRRTGDALQRMQDSMSPYVRH